MSGPTLVDELRRKARDDAAAIWSEARSAADRHRETRASEIAEQRTRSATQLAVRTLEFERAATADAERTARGIIAAAKANLADRVNRLAAESLPRLREGDYPRLFATLAAELPPLACEIVTVNPLDANLARSLFPQAQVASSPSITGGLEAAVDGGRIRVTNTFEARLRNAWPDILPVLVREVLTEVSHSQPAA